VAVAIKNVGFGFGADDCATAEVCLRPAGAVVRIGAAEVGQGAATVLTQIAADALGLPFERVTLEWRDSGRVPEAGSVSASRLTMIAGGAVERACRAARRKMGTRGLPERGEVVRRAVFRARRTTRLAGGATARHMAEYGSGATVADVTVDLDTGEVTVDRVVVGIDVGRVINPPLALGQVEGGVVMGQGYTLQERCLMREGLPLSIGFDHCRVPTALDAAPRIEMVLLEGGDRGTGIGARGLGELTMIPVTPAITAAIYDACGVWVDELPATPALVRAAIATRKAALGRQMPQ